MTRSARGPKQWADAAADLATREELAGALLARHGPPVGIRHSAPAERFGALARAITYQQLSGRAASAIWARVNEAVGDPTDPVAVAAADHRILTGAGLSNAKALALADLSDHVLDGRLDLRATGRMDDEAVISGLTQVRGIGVWSAQMFLLFSLGRTDVWPTGDVGVRNGWARLAGAHGLWGREGLLEPAELDTAGEPYRPHRSVMAWWCWREADTLVPT